MTNREKVIKMAKAGKSTDQIMRATGLKRETVLTYRSGAWSDDKVFRNYNTDTDPEFSKRWTAVVNRIRRYYGKAPLPVPDEQKEGQSNGTQGF